MRTILPRIAAMPNCLFVTEVLFVFVPHRSHFSWKCSALQRSTARFQIYQNFGTKIQNMEIHFSGFLRPATLACKVLLVGASYSGGIHAHHCRSNPTLTATELSSARVPPPGEEHGHFYFLCGTNWAISRTTTADQDRWERR